MTIFSHFTTLLALKGNISFDNEVESSVYQTTRLVEGGYIVVYHRKRILTTDNFKKEEKRRLSFAKDVETIVTNLYSYF